MDGEKRYGDEDGCVEGMGGEPLRLRIALVPVLQCGYRHNRHSRSNLNNYYNYKYKIFRWVCAY
jgi:hypothetical protein